MSRVVFVNLTQTEVTAACATEKVGISAMECLPAGGVRLVCMSSDGAHRMTRKFKAKIITCDVIRQPYRPRTTPW